MSFDFKFQLLKLIQSIIFSNYNNCSKYNNFCPYYISNENQRDIYLSCKFETCASDLQQSLEDKTM